MKLHLVPAKNGFLWFSNGLKTFWLYPFNFVSLFLVVLLPASLITIISPLLGLITIFLSFQFLTLIMTLATKLAINNINPNLINIYSELKNNQDRIQPLFILSFIYLLFIISFLIINNSLSGGDLFKLYFDNKSLTEEEINKIIKRKELGLSNIFLIILQIINFMLFWFAPVLVFSNKISPIKSLFFSFITCLKNFKSFLIFFLSFILFAFLIIIFITIIPKPFNAFLLSLFLFILMSLFFCTIYFSYKDCFNFSDIYLNNNLSNNQNNNLGF